MSAVVVDREHTELATSLVVKQLEPNIGAEIGGVDLRHRSTGIRIRCCRESSQALNRFLARRLLADELEARLQNKTRYEVKAEKIREAKGKRSASSMSDKLRQYVLRPIERENDR